MFKRVRESENACIYFIAIGFVVTGLTIAGMILITGVGRDSVDVTVEVPDRFRGLIRIVIDPNAEELPVVNNGLHIKVPDNGFLAASNYPTGWMSEKSNYASGKTLPVYPGDYTEQETSSMIMLRGLGTFYGTYVIDGVTTGPTEEVRYIVGTRENFLTALDHRNRYTSKTMVWFDPE